MITLAMVKANGEERVVRTLTDRKQAERAWVNITSMQNECRMYLHGKLVRVRPSTKVRCA